jgi:hypothetical protein
MVSVRPRQKKKSKKKRKTVKQPTIHDDNSLPLFPSSFFSERLLPEVFLSPLHRHSVQQLY